LIFFFSNSSYFFLPDKILLGKSIRARILYCQSGLDFRIFFLFMKTGKNEHDEEKSEKHLV
jgi:hypothetical protein